MDQVNKFGKFRSRLAYVTSNKKNILWGLLSNYKMQGHHSRKIYSLHSLAQTQEITAEKCLFTRYSNRLSQRRSSQLKVTIHCHFEGFQIKRYTTKCKKITILTTERKILCRANKAIKPESPHISPLGPQRIKSSKKCF